MRDQSSSSRTRTSASSAGFNASRDGLGRRPIDLDLCVVGPYPLGAPLAFERRAMFPTDGATVEDPVIGSLNASAAQWLLGNSRATAPDVASQGATLGRAGGVEIEQEPDGTIWGGGGTITCITGQIEL